MEFYELLGRGKSGVVMRMGLMFPSIFLCFYLTLY